MQEAAGRGSHEREARERSGTGFLASIRFAHVPCIGAFCALSALFAAGTEAAEAESEIRLRIESAFELVPGNAADLAVPLTRRALARRKSERAAPGTQVFASAVHAAAALAQAAQDNAQAAALYGITTPESAAAEHEDIEEGDAADPLDEPRLPRLRPDLSPTAEPASAASLNDLVASAAPAEPPGADVPAAAVQSAQLLASGAATAASLATASRPEWAPRPRPQTDGEAAPLVVAALGSTNDPTASVPSSIEGTPTAGEPADCLPLNKVVDKDKDFGRNAELLEEPGLCIGQQTFRERRRPWTVQTVSSGRPGPLWAVMHDDEDVAFDTAVRSLKTYGGTLVAVETGGRRNQDGIDPNRNFSDAEIGCAKLGDSASPVFTAIFSKLIEQSNVVFALHNNSGRQGGGLGHLSMDVVPKDMRKSPSGDRDGPMAGDRNLILLAATAPVSASVEARMKELSGRGVNVVLEPVTTKASDCSLSNYTVLSGHDSYYNVTVDKEEGERQSKIIDVIMAGAVRVSAAR